MKLPWKVSKQTNRRQLIRATLVCGEFDVERYSFRDCTALRK
jgi:hypothetical protein